MRYLRMCRPPCLDCLSIFKSHSLFCIAVIALTVLTSGCTLNRKYINRELAFPEEPFEVGVAHRDDVLAQLGPPLKLTRLPHGYAFMYEGLDTLELQIGFSLPVPVISWFKFVFAQADYDHLVLVYLFDNEHQLTAVAAKDTPFDLGSSTAVQPVITVQSMFDTSAVEEEIIDFTEWPAYCLLPLPQTLNRHNAVNIGTTGFEQRGTSPRCGQRSTEFHKQ